MCPLLFVLAESEDFFLKNVSAFLSLFSDSELQFIFDELTSFYSNVLSLFLSFMLILLMDV